MAAAVSARFAALVVGSYQLVARVEVLNQAGAVVLDSASSATPLQVTGGSITVDGSASFRRYISDLTIVDPTGTLVPTRATDPFSAVANNELRLSVGILVDGTAEYVPQGIFHLEGATVEDTPAGLTITLSAYDRARRYSRARRVTPKRFDQNAATPIYTAIGELLSEAVPGTTVNHSSPAHLTTEQVIDVGADPWEAARDLADSMGHELFFDRLGGCQLAAVPDPALIAAPHWTYAEGVTSALLSVHREQSNEETYNGVVVTGENPASAEPVRVLVTDDDPASPTYWLGAYGKVPEFWQSDKVRSVDQATAAGLGRLNRYKGGTEMVTFSIVPNPAIEPGDAVRVVRARSKMPATGPGSELLIVDRYSISLGATGGAMTVGCRQRRLA
jgi:hypothetical protein